MLSADAEAKAFLKTKNKEITLGIVQVQHLEGSSVGKIRVEAMQRHILFRMERHCSDRLFMMC